jgi:hypothetical protein
MSYNQAPLPKETIYDFLRGLVGRVPWKDEGERLRYTKLLDELEKVNIFGYMAQKVTTRMEDEV